MKRIVSLFCAVAILVSCFAFSASAASSKKDAVKVTDADVAALEKQLTSEGTYSHFLYNDAFPDAKGDEIVLEGTKASAGVDSQGRSYLEWPVVSAVQSRYYIKVNYCVTDKTRDIIERMITVNGKVPYDELAEFILEREYYDVSDPELDYYGNEIRAESDEQREQISNYIYDYSYKYSEPLSINLDAGASAAFRFTTLECDAEINSIVLIPVGNVVSYKDWYADHSSDTVAADKSTFTQQAEKYTGKSSTTIYPIADISSPITYPYVVGKINLNSVGGYHWNLSGQSIKWTVNAPESGLYKLTLRARQNSAPGVTVSRTLSINGEIPFKEAMDVSFRYDSSWKVVTLGGDEDYYFYLNKGDNEIKLQNTLGKMDTVLRVLTQSINTFNAIYRKWLPVLSASPDLLRDYHIDRLFPEQVEQLNTYEKVFVTCAEWIESYCGSGNSGAALVRTFIRQLKEMYEDPDKIPEEYTYFKSNIGSLSTWLAEAGEQPLELDCLVVGNDASQYPKDKANFFRQLVFDAVEYYQSYVTDYSTIGTREAPDKSDSLTVWISAGRDQAQIISNLTVKDFTTKTGIPVSIKNTAANLMTATVAGIGPDLVVSSGADVFNYAMRNAAYPLSSFKDFNEVAKRFDPSALIGMKYLDKYYGLPESATFSMLFYRTDILNEMNLAVPQTWDDLISVSSILGNNNMEIALAQAATSYYTLLAQNNIDVYADDGKVCVLDSVPSIGVFDQFTNFFKSYGFPLSYSFVNRFRTGEMPIGVESFVTYNTLCISAPEINGLWKMTLAPGTKDEKGNINRTQLIAPSATMMLADTDHPNEAWEFMKWWLDADTQIAFADEIESVLGPSARYNSANVEAFASSNWNREQRNLINSQRKYLTAVPPVPGGYYLDRNVNTALRSVIYDDASPTDAMYEYVYKINQEIDKKRTEFGLELRAEASVK